jgi:hypothetical protein
MFDDAISRAAVIAHLREHMGKSALRMAASGDPVGASHTAADLEHAIRLIETMPAMESTNA